jgi:subtilisin family serine protease
MCARNVDEDGMVGYSPGCSLLAASIGMPKHTLLLLQQEFMDKNPDAQMTDWQKEMLNHMVEIRKFSDTWLDYVTRCTAEAIDYLVRHDAKVINISAYLSKQLLMRNPTYAKRLDVAFKNAIDNDVVVVIGSGNNNMGVTDYPGTVDSVLVVGASTLADERWELTSEHLGMKITQGSCYGPRLSVMAPSENLLVAEPHDESHYTFQDSPSGKEKTEFEGAYKTTPFGATSCATPVVSSLVALVRSLRPDLPAAEVIRIIKQGAVDIGEDGRDSHTGHGRVDFLKTLTIARDWPAGKRTPGAETEASRDPTPGPQAGG